MRLSRQEYYSGLLYPPPGDLPNLGIKLAFPALAGRFFTAEPLEKPPKFIPLPIKMKKIRNYLISSDRGPVMQIWLLSGRLRSH